MACSDVKMPIYQGVIGSRHVVVVDWSVDGVLPDGRRFSVAVRRGFVFDGASIPRVLWRLCGHPLEVPRVAAALAHDWLYASHAVGRADADAIYREICRMVGIGWLRRGVEYLALRLCGGAAWRSHGNNYITFARSHGAVELENERKSK